MLTSGGLKELQLVSEEINISPSFKAALPHLHTQRRQNRRPLLTVKVSMIKIQILLYPKPCH